MEYFGYCRISTPKQSIERQVRNIKELYPDAHIVEEVYTGTTTQRPKWDTLKKRILRTAAKGEAVTVIFDSVSRMSRDAAEGFALYQELYDAGVEMVFLKEPHINSETYKKSLQVALPETGTSVDILLDGVRRYLMELAKEQIRIAFDQSEKEVMDLRRRTAEGIMTAKLRGEQIGRVEGKKYATQKMKRAVRLIQKRHVDWGGTLQDADMMQILGCCRNSYYKYKRLARTGMAGLEGVYPKD